MRSSGSHSEADEVVCPYIPEYFYAIGQFFDDFGQVNDEEVMEILRLHSRKADQNVGG